MTARGGRVEAVVLNQTQPFQQFSEFVFVIIIVFILPCLSLCCFFCVRPVCSSLRGKGQSNTESDLSLSEIRNWSKRFSIYHMISFYLWTQAHAKSYKRSLLKRQSEPLRASTSLICPQSCSGTSECTNTASLVTS